MAELYITSQKLVETLKIATQDLIDAEEFFDSIPDDEWELTQGKDYKVVNKTTGLREYTSSGAYTIARYLEATQKQTFWQRLTEWFTHTKREISKAFIKKHILDNSSSLIKRNGQFFVSRSDLVTIFKTRSDYLSKMAEHTQKTQYPLIKGEDFEDFVDKGGLHFSLSGISKLSHSFKECQSKKNRQEWCGDVGVVVGPQISDIVAEIQNREKRIQTAMDKVKKRDHNTCQVTGQKKNRVDRLKLSAHHLYSQNGYPHLADVENNLLTLDVEVHERFHQDYMGGTTKPCTIDDFISFVQAYYPSNAKVVIWLDAQKRVLGNPQPEDQRKPHVLYLPASRVI
ncbi:hypothetical protein C7B65_24300 [Phormidesmis priestleyi ULC007]|uniref:Uncharacterized protein n=1 Tax=Phormidesmis priestleyi ULC007 TaxID=1920490 RepID=A0A2T1D4X4_9CYAN|nr:hypothetical protein [Phormidesmis priestleyi]PSB15474.1 hypothetical protein C7B65_24300 [Phormidesmis priestleyi ULC007]PZO46161.1 MAG: hypothetical protein DCF14_23560 [Phormidesmis priestleyi]